MNVKSTLGGLAGACTLTLLNQSGKLIDKDAPSLDLLGMNAVARIMKGNDFLPRTAETLFPAALAGDLITNSLYYSLADTGDKKKNMIRGTLLGLGAGISAVALPKTLGLNENIPAPSTKTKMLTVAWYVIGGLVAAAAINLMQRDRGALKYEV